MGFLDSIKKFGEKTKEKFNGILDYSAQKISESGNFSIKTKEDLDKLLEKSDTTEFQNKDTGEIKYFKHKSILIIIDEKTDFYKSISLVFPILKTKAFSQNMNIMLSKTKIQGINYKDLFGLEKFPVMVVFENREIYKTIIGQENIEKITKSIKMNMEEEIEQF